MCVLSMQENKNNNNIMKMQSGEVGLTREPTCPLNVCVCVCGATWINFLSVINSLSVYLAVCVGMCG